MIKKQKRKRKLNKKNLAILLGGTLAILAVCIFFLLKGNHDNTHIITAYINDKEMTSYSTSITLNEDFDVSPDAIYLRVEDGNQDITNLLNYTQPTFDEVKKYTVHYTYESYTFTMTIDVKEASATASKPIIDAKDEYTILLNEPFDFASLGILAYDSEGNQIHDISYRGTINTEKVGNYPIEVSVSDAKGQTSVKEITIRVDETIISPGDFNVTIVTNPDDIDVCIDKQHLLPDGWEPSDLVNVLDNHILRKEAADAFTKLYNQAHADGVNLVLVSSYRTQAYQASLYDSYMTKDPVNAPFYSAVPRSSEHELGLAVDVSYDYNLHDDLDEHEVGKWMNENAHVYGFIMSYPENKTQITGYSFEPWHYRYVGIDLAKHLKENNLVLQEYK